MEQQLYCLNHPSARVRAVAPLFERHAESFAQSAIDAARHGQEKLAHLTVWVGESDVVGRQLRVGVGRVRAARRPPRGLSAAMEAVKSSSLVPRTDTRLEVVTHSQQPPRSQLILFGTCEPPAGVVGDTHAMQRVVEATVQQRAGRQP